jgi:division/cell wall cluster transcriptional repressor MraZ
MEKTKHTGEPEVRIKLESFIGKATVAIDATGRTNFPKDFRKVLRDEAGGQVVVTIAEGKTLALYPVYAWNDYVQYLESLGRGAEVSKHRTRITSMAKLSVLDAQNRISLTAEQMEYAGIAGEVTFVGDGKRVRLWAPGKYAEQIEVVTPDEEKQFENWF